MLKSKEKIVSKTIKKILNELYVYVSLRKRIESGEKKWFCFRSYPLKQAYINGQGI